MSCKKGNKDKGQVQKVVIPKGMINPGETTIIEIPSALQKQPIVVAKRKTSMDEMNPAVKKCCGKKSKNKEGQGSNKGHYDAAKVQNPVNKLKYINITSNILF